MPHEKRDPHSKARLFIPTHSERVHVQSRKQLKQDMEDITKLKKELEGYLGLLKGKDGQA
jgi:hypothetical protein